MKIGELAQATGTSIESIRFYEREGLVSEPVRTGGNFRLYDDTHVQRLAFIRRCRSLDMALDEIRVLLRFKDAPGADCADVNALLDEHIEHVASRVRELRVLEKELRGLRAQCQSIESGAECGILKTLSDGASPAAEGRHPGGGVHSHGSAVHGAPGRRAARPASD